ncbi:asparaginase [Favolaschia claudopus]|uniref:Asparaginase n=1 Tax=Favolaschia claudopus TaxID=2862362 RepID=A0AAW0ACY0_9AGAR
MQLNTFFTALVVVAAANHGAIATVVQFSTSSGCSSFQDTYQGDCNFCSDPPGDFASVLFSDLPSSYRVTVHNEDNCTPASQVGQGFGAACWNKGGTALRSAWVACAGQKREMMRGDNTTADAADKATLVA